MLVFYFLPKHLIFNSAPLRAAALCLEARACCSGSVITARSGSYCYCFTYSTGARLQQQEDEHVRSHPGSDVSVFLLQEAFV